MGMITIDPDSKKKFQAAAEKAGYPSIKTFIKGEYEKKRHTMKRLGVQTGMSYFMVKKFLKGYGFQTNLFQADQKKYEDLDMPRVMMLRNSGKIYREIAADQGSSISSIRKAIKRYTQAHPTITAKTIEQPPKTTYETNPRPVFEYPSAAEILAAQYPAAWAFANHGASGVRGVRWAKFFKEKAA